MSSGSKVCKDRGLEAEFSRPTSPNLRWNMSMLSGSVIATTSQASEKFLFHRHLPTNYSFLIIGYRRPKALAEQMEGRIAWHRHMVQIRCGCLVMKRVLVAQGIVPREWAPPKSQRTLSSNLGQWGLAFTGRKVYSRTRSNLLNRTWERPLRYLTDATSAPDGASKFFLPHYHWNYFCL